MSKLQELARTRNSYYGRIKGLRNNIRGILHNPEGLHEDEIEDLTFIESQLDLLFKDWKHNWNHIKSDL